VEGSHKQDHGAPSEALSFLTSIWEESRSNLDRDNEYRDSDITWLP
jgi:hypothetical protein